VRAPIAVLVVPAEGDPGGLLALAMGGGQPPVVRRCVSMIVDVGAVRWVPGAPQLRGRKNRRETALPLWWDGDVVAEGWDRARRLVDGDHRLPADAMEYVHDFYPSVFNVLTLAGWLIEAGAASRIVLLDRADDGSIAERAP
jgi:hypothetical protein